MWVVVMLSCSCVRKYTVPILHKAEEPAKTTPRRRPSCPLSNKKENNAAKKEDVDMEHTLLTFLFVAHIPIVSVVLPNFPFLSFPVFHPRPCCCCQRLLLWLLKLLRTMRVMRACKQVLVGTNVRCARCTQANKVFVKKNNR